MCDWTCVGLGDVWLDMCRVGGCVAGHVCVGLGDVWLDMCRDGGCVAGYV